MEEGQPVQFSGPGSPSHQQVVTSSTLRQTVASPSSRQIVCSPRQGTSTMQVLQTQHQTLHHSSSIVQQSVIHRTRAIANRSISYDSQVSSSSASSSSSVFMQERTAGPLSMASQRMLPTILQRRHKHRFFSGSIPSPLR